MPHGTHAHRGNCIVENSEIQGVTVNGAPPPAVDNFEKSIMPTFSLIFPYDFPFLAFPPILCKVQYRIRLNKRPGRL